MPYPYEYPFLYDSAVAPTTPEHYSNCLELDKRLSGVIGDFIELELTTAITADNNIISTNFNKWDDGKNNRLNGYHLLITDGQNAGVDRGIRTYTTDGGVCEVYGDTLASDGTDKAKVRLYKYSYTIKQVALNDALLDIGLDVLATLCTDTSLITGSILQDGHFGYWTRDTIPTFYTASANAELTEITEAGYYRGQLGGTSMKVEAGASDQYAYTSSTSYPRLGNLVGKSIDIAVWVRPTTDNDAFMDVIYNKGGVDTTISTTTNCKADVFTLLKRENITIPDDIASIEFRFRVHTSGESAYFDNASVIGYQLRDYLLPEALQNGSISEVYIQSIGSIDDVAPRDWKRLYNSTYFTFQSQDYLRLATLPDSNRQLRLVGTSGLDALTSVSDIRHIDERGASLLVVYAAHCIFRNEENCVSPDLVPEFERLSNKYLAEYERLKGQLRTPSQGGTMMLRRP